MTLQTLSAWIINLKCEPGAEALMRKLMEIWRAEAKESVDSNERDANAARRAATDRTYN